MSTPSPQEPVSKEVREYLGVLRSRNRTVIIVAAVVVAATCGFTALQKPMYQATSQLLVTFSSTAAGSGANNKNLGSLNTEKAIIQSPAVAGPVKDTLGLSVEVSALVNHVKVDVVSGATVLNVHFTDQNPNTAALIADAFADSYVAFKQQQAKDAMGTSNTALRRQIATVQDQIAQVEKALEAATAKGTIRGLQNRHLALSSTLVDLQARLTEATSANQTSARVIKEADPPKSPVSPNWKRNVLGAVAIGLALGVAIAFAGEAMDDRVKSRRELQQISGVPTLASIPRVKAWHKRNAHGAHLVQGHLQQGPVSEAYRTLATNILHLASQEPLHTLMVTSSVAGEGKTTTAANLAVALARLDRSVCLVGLDLRASGHQLFGLDNQVGLTTVLLNSLPIEDAVRDTEFENLRVVPGGPPDADPSELVSKFRDGKYLEQLREAAEFVILDAPSVLGVADSSILAPLTDGVVLVVDADLATRSEVRDALEQLRNAGAKVRGTAHNEVRSDLAAYYPYEQPKT